MKSFVSNFLFGLWLLVEFRGEIFQLNGCTFTYCHNQRVIRIMDKSKLISQLCVMFLDRETVPNQITWEK